MLASEAAVADALSTAFYVGGLDLARRYCAGRPDVAALILPENGDALVALNLAPHEFAQHRILVGTGQEHRRGEDIGVTGDRKSVV